MDALKKAEEEKKLAAKRLQEVEADSLDSTSEQEILDEEKTGETNDGDKPVPELFTETSQFSLEPLALEEKQEPEEAIVEESATPTVEPVELEETAALSFSEDMTMEHSISEELNLQENFEQSQKEIDLNDTTIIEGLTTENAAAPFDDTFHGVVFEEETETDLYEETLPGVPADTLARDLGGGDFQPTPVAAKTVFSAGKPAKRKSSFKWGVFAVLALLATGSFAIFYYFTITPVSRDLPSPMVARGIEFSGVETPIAIPPVVKQQENQTNTVEVIESNESKTAKELVNKEIVEKAFADEKSEKQALIAEFDQQSIESAPELELSEQASPESTSQESSIPSENIAVDNNKVEAAINLEEQKPEQVEKIVESNDEKLIADREETALAAEAQSRQLDTSLINISKSKKNNQGDEILGQAFKAYQAGHYDAASSLYRNILKEEPDNRDAHLGLAAIAINNQDRKSAYSHYIYLVELDPLDTLAMSSLIALSNSPDPVKDESAIKLLIQRNDSVPYLHFLLGNLYAKQNRWSNAQESFFDAYRLDSDNSDYVLNLAISLDQLGQYKTALDYYKSAIELSANSVSGFNLAPVQSRISSLSKIIGSK
jgi:Flp pilus assembly protein TadD